MNKVILTHLENLSKKANNTYRPTSCHYKPLSPFCTNKVQKITEEVEPMLGFKLSNILQNKHK